MATVSKGAVGSTRTGKKAAPKLGQLLADEDAKTGDAVAFVSRKGADSAFIVPPGPKHNANTGVQVGFDNGVYLDFQGVGVTRAYYPKTNKPDRITVQRIEEAIEEGLPIIEDLGLEILQPEAPRPPFAKWDGTSAAAIKVALSVLFDEDDHTANVEVVKAAGRYEKANQNRTDVLSVLDALLAVEATESDDFDVEVAVK